MIFITKVKLNNFQSHKSTEVEFHRGLNVIEGHSDSGKTAILRGIKWAIFNEPTGDYFIREGEKEVSVEIEFNTGAVVRRFKTASKNGYYLKKADGEEINFDGFGTKVPKEIIEEIKISKINLDEKASSMINISEQLEGPFLLNEKGSVRASAIGRLVGVNYIDDALRDTIRDKKQVSSNLKNMYIRQNELKNELSNYDYLEKYEKAYNSLNDIKNEIEIKKGKLDKLIILQNKYNEVNKEYKENIEILSKYSNLEYLQNLKNKIEIKILKYRQYNKQYENLNYVIKDISKNEDILLKYSSIEDLYKIADLLDNKIRYEKTVRTLGVRIEETKENIEIISKELNKYKETSKAEKIYNELINMISIYEKIKTYNDNLKNLNFSIEKGHEYLKRFDNMDKIDFIIKEISIKITDYEMLEKNKIKLQEIEKERKKISDTAIKIDKNIDIGIEKYNEILSKNGYCPVCLSKIDNNTYNHIKEHYKR